MTDGKFTMRAWMRLFAILAACWVGIVAILFLKDVFIYAVIPIGLLFVAIFGVAWVREGIKKQD